MTFPRKLRWSAVAVLFACVGACSKPAAPPPEPEEPGPTAPAADIQALADGNNAFAIDLYKKLAAEEKGNVIFSPYSVRTALGMTYGGARGQTAAEMRKALHLTLPDERLHPAFGATSHQLKGGKEKQYELNVANALWGQTGFPFRPEFLELTKTNYAAGFREADFKSDPEPARQAINRWVEEKTQDRIKELLKPKILTERTRLVLVNAIYFKGQWAEQFDARLTADDTFRVTPERTVPVRMMHHSAKFGYAETDDAQFLSMPYKSSDESQLAMAVILPKTIDGLARVEAQLSAAQLQKWFQSMSNRRGNISLPKFTVAWGDRLKPHLSQLGMPSAFDPDTSDFSGIVADGADPADRQLFIAEVIHKAMAEVNEEGTVAAAATAVVMAPPAAPAEPFTFRADHPFLFCIYAPRTGAVLFLGRFVVPS